MKKIALFVFFYALGFFSAVSQQIRGIVETPELQVLMEDIAVVERKSQSGERTGIDLYVRKKPRIQSVMLLETTIDPEGKQPNYAYRASEWNSVNGDEIRYLDGKPLESEYSKYSLVSSTVAKHPALGECFHIFIPNTLSYGYPWSRHGTVTIGKGTFINIRTYEKKYADYTGKYMDNPFMVDLGVVENTIPPQEKVVLTDDYNSVAAAKFSEIADEGNGLLTYSKGPDSLTDDLLSAVDRIADKSRADIIFAVDTTGSMKDDLETLKNEWLPKFRKQLESFNDVRIGLLFYRDYKDNYNYKGLPVKLFDFTKDCDQFEKSLGSAYIKGNEGGDVPEAVYEALFASLQYFNWRKEASKKIILIGDAEPHEKPRGSKKISKDKVMKLAEEKNVTLDCIILPDAKEK